MSLQRKQVTEEQFVDCAKAYVADFGVDTLKEVVEVIRNSFKKEAQSLPSNQSHQARIQARTEQLKALQKNMAIFEPVSLNQEIGKEDDGAELGDMLVSPDFKDELDRQREFTQLIERVIKSGILTPKEINVLKMRYGIDCNDACTLEEVGQKFKLTRERVRQIESVAIRKAKAFLQRSNVTIDVLE